MKGPSLPKGEAGEPPWYTAGLLAMDRLDTFFGPTPDDEHPFDEETSGGAVAPAEEPQKSGSRPLRRLAQAIGVLIALVFLAWLILYITKGRFLKHPFERYVSKSLARDVKVAGDFQLYFAPFNVKFLAEGMTIANPPWAKQPYFFRSKLIDTRISTWTLIFGNRRVNWLQLAGGNVDLEWDAQAKRNTWTFGDPNQPARPLDIPNIRAAVIEGSHLTYNDPVMQLSANIDIDTVRANDTRLSNTVSFSGGGSIRARPFRLQGSLLSPNETVTGGTNKLRLAAHAGATRMRVEGTLPGATEIEGANLKMAVEGNNMSELFDFLGVAVPDTRKYHLTSALTKQKDQWRFTGLKGMFGESDLAGRLVVAMPADRLKLDAVLQTRVLDIVDAGPFIGYNPQRLESKGVIAASTQTGGTPRILPDAPLRVDAIRRFDAHLDYKVAQVRARNVPVSNIGLILDLDRSLLTLSPLTFDMAGGHVSSDISINARRQPIFTRYDIRLSPTPMGKLLARWGVEESGTTGTLKARIAMSGSGDSVRQSLATSNGRIAVVIPQGSFWTRNIQLSELDLGTFVQKMFENKLKKPVEINCGLVAFTVRNGIAAADPILIDTKKNVMLGRGGFSFRNETLDLAYRADGKQFSIFSAQSPIGIGGYFAAPKIDVVSPELVARAGGGLGLGVLASPFAAVLAFVDVGDAKAASCGPVLAGAHASAQRTKGGKPRDDVGRGTTAKSEDGKVSKAKSDKQKKKFLGIF